MTTVRFYHAAIAALALLLSSQASANSRPADPTPEQVIGAYAAKCRKLADAPKPMGEWDLKGNAKLAPYCDCYARFFFERAITVAAYMQSHGGKAPPATLKQIHAQEMVMRNTCREQLDLPKAVAPKPVAPAKKPK